MPEVRGKRRVGRREGGRSRLVSRGWNWDWGSSWGRRRDWGWKGEVEEGLSGPRVRRRVVEEQKAGSGWFPMESDEKRYLSRH
jgi:hypothetical protein